MDIKWVDYGSNCHCKEIIPYEASITTQYNTNNTHSVYSTCSTYNTYATYNNYYIQF